MWNYNFFEFDEETMQLRFFFKFAWSKRINFDLGRQTLLHLVSKVFNYCTDSTLLYRQC